MFVCLFCFVTIFIGKIMHVHTLYMLSSVCQCTHLHQLSSGDSNHVTMLLYTNVLLACWLMHPTQSVTVALHTKAIYCCPDPLFKLYQPTQSCCPTICFCTSSSVGNILSKHFFCNHLYIMNNISISF